MSRSLPVLLALLIGVAGGVSGTLAFIDDDRARTEQVASPSPATRSSPSSAEPTPPRTSAPSPTPPAVEAEQDYPYEGYPRLVSTSEVPSQMRSYIDGEKAVAVAPGVWTQHVPGIPLEDLAYDGAYIGYCASVDRAVARLGNDNGSTCW